MNRLLPPIQESLSALEKLLKQSRLPEHKRRLHMLVLFKSGQAPTRQAVASHLAVHRHTIRQWLKLYEKSGIDGLLERKKTGPKEIQKSLEPAVFEALQQRLKTPEGFSGYIEIQKWLADTYGVKLPYRTVHGMVRDRLGAKLKSPRPEHPKKTLNKQ